MAKENGKAPTSVLSDILLLLLKILIVILLFVLLFTFLFGATRYNDVAMEPNIKSGDLVIYSRIDKDFDVGQEAALKYQGKTQVMRVVATAGDTVDMTKDGFTVNGTLQEEPNPQKRFPSPSKREKSSYWAMTAKTPPTPESTARSSRRTRSAKC